MQPLNENPLAWQGAMDVPPELRAFQPCALPGMDAPAAVDPGGPVDFWFSYIMPTYNQQGPSCVGQSWANWIEAMVRRFVNPAAFKVGEQIDGEAIWKRGRELFFGGDMGGGLFLPQGLAAAKSLGFLPPDAQPVKVPQTWGGICAALRQTPIVQGHRIHSGWFSEDRKSGCIDHQPAPDNTGAHATLLIATLQHADVTGAARNWIAFQNSWGADRGRAGVYLMTWEEWTEGTMFDAPYTATGINWRTWRGWEKGIARK